MLATARLHADARAARRRPGARRVPAGERGQGTVEYVALVTLVAIVMVGVIAALKSATVHRGPGARRADPEEDHGGREQGEVLRPVRRAGVASPAVSENDTSAPRPTGAHTMRCARSTIEPGFVRSARRVRADRRWAARA